MIGIKAIAVAAVLAAGMGSADANLLTNGDFETHDLTGWYSWKWNNNGGWTNVQTDGNSLSGYYAAIGNTNGTAGIYQIVTGIVPGQTYTLTVDAGAQAWWWPEGKMQILFQDSGGTTLLSPSVKTTPDFTNFDVGQPWTPFTITEVAPAGATQAKVEFSMTYGNGTVWFDNAVLSVPEPGAMLALGGCLALAGLRRQRTA